MLHPTPTCCAVTPPRQSRAGNLAKPVRQLEHTNGTPRSRVRNATKAGVDSLRMKDTRYQMPEWKMGRKRNALCPTRMRMRTGSLARQGHVESRLTLCRSNNPERMVPGVRTPVLSIATHTGTLAPLSSRKKPWPGAGSTTQPKMLCSIQ